MEPIYIQTLILAVLQGITEFLPISSSAHLILPAKLFGWPDQGLAFDVMVHLGSLLSVIVYFRRDLRSLATAWFRSLGSIVRKNRPTQSAQIDHPSPQQAILAWCLLLATVPAGMAGLLLQELVSDAARNTVVIALASIIFGLALLLADWIGGKQRSLEFMNWRAALVIGLAQCLALIPGASRSGITMAAALLLGFTRESASRFSFLLAIPIIAASSLLMLRELLLAGIGSYEWLQLFIAMLLSAVVAWCCIHFFLRLINNIGFMPFVFYRLVLGMVLLGTSLA
ncbi:MAG: undecaprenyl-diphosphate phosphatase [Gammaproteobacteria bacterium]|nr:undecaprenyl-diphosphate phosphatase [Gammaproteobacteria bacterium]MCY4356516.1 undecaprenyl-diphosphate phosphatase [Gammaproteobacteria bacterium]